MRTRHEALIHASWEAILALASDVERWPSLHPAYRWCRVLERTEAGVLFEMGGRIRGWPARWRAYRERFPGERRVVFRHVGGITRGMVVEWRLQPEAGGATRVQIVHDLVLSWPVIGRLVGDRIVGPIFIDWIARRTLLGLRQALE